jgi:succinate dehydrogenase / fumarate reductase flavoprotein subunit
MSIELDPKIPDGEISEKWLNWLDGHKLVGPRNRNEYKVIVVGTGLAGASAAATMAGMGYRVDCYCYQDSARRAHSIAAQGGINATKDYANEGDSVHRLFVDTIKGGDFRSREANVWRLAELSTGIIDQAVAQGVPFNREYGGMLATRSFGGVLVERTFYCRGQTGQQLLLGAYQSLQKQVHDGQAEIHPRHEMLDLVIVDGRARGIVARNLVTGELEACPADAVVLATGGYCNVYYLSTNAKNSNATAIWRAHKRGAAFANPCFTQIHPTCIPQSGDYQSKLTLMSESLRNDGRIWVPKDKDEERPPQDIPEGSASTTSRNATRVTATSFPATSPHGRRRSSATRATGSAPPGAASTSTSPMRSRRRAPRRSPAATGTSSRCTSGSPGSRPGRRR